MKISAQAFHIGHYNQSAGIENVNAVNGGAQSFGDPIVVPGGAWPLNADFVRQGPDLLISGPDGESFIVRDYFFRESAADIHTEGGAVLPGAIVERLTGALAQGQFAQTNSEASNDIVGRVETVLGNATALRVDGTQVELTAGDPIMAGDVLQTAAEASLGVVFADKTTMSLGGEGRLVVDDFVYDPQANAGGMSINVVQGVFTFVSGEIAKIGPDTMTVYTPVATVGIRGTKVAGRAAAEGEQNTISLLPNEDGTVGVIAVGNQSGAAPQILTNAGATTTITSQFQAPAPQIVYSQAQIQQQYGNALQTLDAAQQSIQTRQENQPDQSGEQQGEAAPGEAEGEASEGEEAEQGASGTPEPEGEGVSEEEQAARDAAEAAERDGETPEGTLEAAIEAAADRALAEGASPEEVAEAEAEARDAYNEAIANGESPEAALEAAMESVGEAEFSQFAAGAPGEQDGGAPANVQLGRGEGDEGQDEVLGAAQSAAETALSEGASEEEAFDAAVQAAMDAAIARGEDPEEVARIAADVREAHADAIEAGIDPGEAMQLAFNTAGEEDRSFGDPLAPPPPGSGEDIIALAPLSGFDNGFDGFFNETDYFARTFGSETTLEFIEFEPLFFDVPDLFDPNLSFETFDDEPDNIIDLSSDDTVFAEVLVATSGADTLAGGTGNTEFVYSQTENGGFSGGNTDTITDAGGGSDRITFENLDSVALMMANNDTSSVKIDIFLNSGTASTSTLSSGTGDTRIVVTRDVEDLQGSVTDLASFDQGIIVKGALDVTNNETAFILVGSSGADTLTQNSTDAVGALLFGKGGDDTIQLSSATSDHILFGGDGTDTVTYSGIFGSVLFDFFNAGISVTHSDSSDLYDSIENVTGGGNADFIVLDGANATGGFLTIAGGGGDDQFFFEGGASSSATLFGGAGNDSYYFTQNTGASIALGDFNTTGTDRLVFDLNSFLGHDGSGGLLSGNIVFDAAPTFSNHNFLFNTTTNVLSYDADGNGAGAAVDIAVLTGYTLAVADIKFANMIDLAGTATHAVSSVEDIFLGSDSDDSLTLTGAALSGDVYDGDVGNDTLTLDNSGNTLSVLNVETINGGTGADNITAFTGFGGNNNSATINGGSGADSITLASGANFATFIGVETITGSSGNDQLFLDNTITGGSTTIDLGGGTEDVLEISGTNDFSVLNVETIVGSDVNDNLTLNNTQSGVQITLGAGTDTVTLANGGNTVTVNDVETVVGGSGSDTITLAGTSAININGGGGADNITLGTGTASDIIKYVAVSDSTSGSADTIANFNAVGADQIDISALLQGTFAFIGGNGAFTNTGNTEARFNDGTDTLQIDTNGDSTVDMEVILTGVIDSDLSAADFIAAGGGA